jgi:hypothetical protein
VFDGRVAAVAVKSPQRRGDPMADHEQNNLREQGALSARRFRYLAQQLAQIAERIEWGLGLPEDDAMSERVLLALAGGRMDRIGRVMIIAALRAASTLDDLALLEADQDTLAPEQAARIEQLNRCAEDMHDLKMPTTVEQLAMHEAIALKLRMDHLREGGDAGPLKDQQISAVTDKARVSIARQTLDLFPELSRALTDDDLLGGLRAYARAGGGAKHEDAGKWAELAKLVRRAGLSSIGSDELRKDYVQWSLRGHF